ncbi:InlB B-repeat-containing protein [Paenibacillus sp. GSMTC-2017]|uniref:InlB B-repeat-containing protein n=1 Tax=Paenibacillus sp. GSMTC-2017 TaxID=2794350 RepID=UPI0018D9508F|nr:InlB B-repeat-containing protein [Paenibacillus sp. GSMTC-2017]MBH5319632.1 InlB B-repeat-containing protein [Paenibacillus sp. GSMTC-2017]
MIRQYKRIVLFTVFIMVFIIVSAVGYAQTQTPASQNFDLATGATSTIGGNLTLDGIVYSTDSVADQVAVDSWTNGSTIGSGNVLFFKYAGNTSGSYFQFESENPTNNFKIKSLELDVYDNLTGFSQVYNVTGYDEEQPIASTTIHFKSPQGVPTTFGSGKDAVSWTRHNGTPGDYTGGVLTFTGSGWGNVDQIRFTDVDNVAHDYIYGIFDNLVLEAPVLPTYTLTYSDNGSSSGNVPVDNNSPYTTGAQTSILDNTGSLTKTGHTFAGWNTAADGNGINYAANDTFTMGTTNTTLYAKWTPNSYTVSFNTNGGTSVSAVNADYNTAITAPATPTKAHYTFEGWYKEAGLATKWNFATDKILGDTTLFAKWTIKTYDVNFDVNGGSSIALQNIDYGSLASKPTDPARTGYAFENWYTDSNYTTLFDFASPISGNTTIYAKWTPISYTVSFNTDGGSVIANVTANYDTTITAPVEPTKAHYTFEGWYKESGLSTKWNFATDKILGNTTLFAKWTVNQYDVNFDVNGGNSITAQHIEYGSLPTKPADPSRTGYTFENWYTDSSFTTLYNFAAPISADTTIYAKWTPINYTISFNVDGGSTIADVTAHYDTAITAPVAPTKDHYTLEGWYKESGLSTKWNFETDKVLGNTTLFAKWKVNQYDVNFDVNGGNSITAQHIEYGSLPTKPADPSRTGYTFENWYADSSFTTLFNFAAPISGNTTIYANWTPNSHTISFNADGGTAVADVNANYDTTIAAPVPPTKDHHTLEGWYKESGLTTKWNFATDKIVGDTTLFAKWTINQYDVNFDVNGGSSITEQHIDHGSLASKPTDPSRTGYTFENWYTDSSFTTLYNFAAPISADTTIYAKWTPISYTVSFNTDGGSSVANLAANYDTTITAPAVPTKSGYTFNGWYKESGYINVWNFTTDKVLSDTTLYASWTYIEPYVPPTTPTTPTPTPTPQPSTEVEVIVDGSLEKSGTSTTTTVNNQETTTITIDTKKLEENLADAGQNVIITVPVTATSDIIIGQLNGELVKFMEEKEASIAFKSEKATYTLSAEQLGIDAISKQLGTSISLQDVTIHIEIAAPSADTLKLAQNAAIKGNFTIVVPPINFNVRATYKDSTIQVADFNSYVERLIAIPNDVDHKRITTGVVIDPDGTVRHVPTKIVLIDGKYYAKVNSLTNSTYSIIWNPVTFKDTTDHWANTAIQDMGSRMIISGKGNASFYPDQEITRAEFAAIIVRALGLKPVQGASPFSDIDANDWYNEEIQTAYAYKLISGFEDGTFRPMDMITREQAMVIIAKAMKITDLRTNSSSISTEQLLQSFTDIGNVSAWAKNSIADCLLTGIISGKNGNELAPQTNITRAEVASMIYKLLQKSDLI